MLRRAPVRVRAFVTPRALFENATDQPPGHAIAAARALTSRLCATAERKGGVRAVTRVALAQHGARQHAPAAQQLRLHAAELLFGAPPRLLIARPAVECVVFIPGQQEVELGGACRFAVGLGKPDALLALHLGRTEIWARTRPRYSRGRSPPRPKPVS